MEQPSVYDHMHANLRRALSKILGALKRVYRLTYDVIIGAPPIDVCEVK